MLWLQVGVSDPLLHGIGQGINVNGKLRYVLPQLMLVSYFTIHHSFSYMSLSVLLCRLVLLWVPSALQ